MYYKNLLKNKNNLLAHDLLIKFPDIMSSADYSYWKQKKHLNLALLNKENVSSKQTLVTKQRKKQTEIISLNRKYIGQEKFLKKIQIQSNVDFKGYKGVSYTSVKKENPASDKHLIGHKDNKNNVKNSSKLISRLRLLTLYYCLLKITGQKPVFTKVKKSVASFNIRSGMETGIKVTLRKSDLERFYKKLNFLVFPASNLNLEFNDTLLTFDKTITSSFTNKKSNSNKILHNNSNFNIFSYEIQKENLKQTGNITAPLTRATRFSLNNLLNLQPITSTNIGFLWNYLNKNTNKEKSNLLKKINFIYKNNLYFKLNKILNMELNSYSKSLHSFPKVTSLHKTDSLFSTNKFEKLNILDFGNQSINAMRNLKTLPEKIGINILLDTSLCENKINNWKISLFPKNNAKNAHKKKNFVLNKTNKLNKENKKAKKNTKNIIKKYILSYFLIPSLHKQ